MIPRLSLPDLSSRRCRPPLASAFLIGLLLTVLPLTAPCPAQQAAPAGPGLVEFYVWGKGDDAGSGDRDAPLKTLGEAIKRARGNGQPTVIRIAAGTYKLDEPIKLGKEDSRSADAPLLITAHSRKKPVIFTAGVSLPQEAWRKTNGADRLAGFLPSRSRGRVRVIELANSPLAEEFPYRPDPEKRRHPPKLLWDGYLLQHSQWPNTGYAYMDKTLDEGPQTRHLKANEKKPEYSFEKPTGGVFTVKDPLDFDRLAREFAATGDIRVLGYLHNDWFFQTEMLGRVDVAKRSLQLVRYTRYGIGKDKIKLPRRLRLVGTISYLDQPGEWCFDQQEKKLYLWPVKQPKAGEPPVQLLGMHGLIDARGVQHVTLRGLTFEGFDDTGLNFQQASHVTIAGCEFRAANRSAIRLQGGTHNTVTGCDFHDMGGGIVMSGVPGNRRTLTPEHNRATNNHFWNLGGRHYGGAVGVNGVGFYFAHNVLHDMQTGLGYSSCNDLVAEYNEFYRMGYEMGDWNPVYAGADLSLRNNTFRYNFFHHLIETPGANPIAGIRADDGASGLHVHANIFYKTGRAAVQFHGPDCSVTNNFVMGVDNLLWTIQQPYDDKTSKPQFMQEKLREKQRIEAEVAGGTRRHSDKANIIGRAESVFGKQGWKTNQVWIKKYPHFAETFDFENFDHSPWAQTFAVVKHNYIDEAGGDFPFHFHGRNPSGSPDAAKKFLPGSAEFWKPYPLDPQRVFVSPGQLDFRFRKRRLKKGVEKFDFEKIGLIIDKHRREAPDKQAYRREVATQFRKVGRERQELDLVEINRRYSPPEYLRLAD